MKKKTKKKLDNLLHKGFWVLIAGLVIYNGYLVFSIYDGNKPRNLVIKPVEISNSVEDRTSFLYEVKPGSVIEDALYIGNNDNSPKTLDTDVVDSEFLTEDKSFAPELSSAQKDFVGAWTTVEKEVAVSKDSEIELPFKISVPADTKAGDYWGAVTVITQGDDTYQSNDSGTSGTRIISRSAYNILVRVSDNGPEEPNSISRDEAYKGLGIGYDE